jgi:hypothetical protein
VIAEDKLDLNQSAWAPSSSARVLHSYDSLSAAKKEEEIAVGK